MQALLDKAKGRTEYSEIYHLKQRVVPVKFAPGGISSAEARRVEGVAMRVVVDDRFGYVASTDLAHSDDIVDAAVTAAAYGAEADLAFPDTPANSLEGLHASGTATQSVESLVALGEEIRRRLAEARPDAEASVGVTLVVDEISYHNTHRVDAAEQSSAIKVSVELARSKPGDVFTVDRGFQARTLSELAVESCTHEVLHLMGLAEDIVAAPSGEMPVVLTSHAAIALVLPLMFSLNGELAGTGMSPFAAKVGETLFDNAFCLCDDGRNVAGSIAGAFDTEGTPTQRTVLIDRGTLQGFFHDRRSAQRMGVEPTGNGLKGGLTSVFGHRQFRPLPEAMFSHFEVATGAASQEDLIREVDNGLLIDSVLGLGQGNILAGEFSNNVAVGYRIENGRVTGRVKDVMISGNSYDLLKGHLLGVGDDPGWFAGRLFSPSIAVSGVNVASR